MARAIRASGDRNPMAILVISRILVLTDSVSPLDRPCSIAARISARCLATRAWSLMNDSIRQRRAQMIHRSSAYSASSRGSRNTVRRPSLRR